MSKENFEEQLEKRLEEWKIYIDGMHMYYFKKAREWYDNHDVEEIPEMSKEEREAYEIGTYNGASAVIETIRFMMFGGKDMWEHMMAMHAEIQEDEGLDGSRFTDMLKEENMPKFTGDEEDE